MNNHLTKNIVFLIKYHRYNLLVACLLWLCISNEALATSVSAQSSPLHQAVMQGDVNAVQDLLQKKTKIDSIDNKDRTPLALAAAHGHTTIVELLLKAGARVNGRKRHTPLSQAALYGQLESMRMLIDHGANVNKFDHAGYTPLHAATMGGSLEAIQLLLSHKAKQNRNKLDHRLPLHIATQGRFAFNRKLLQHVMECERTNNYDEVMSCTDAMFYAPEEEVLSIVRCLVAHGAQVNEKDNEGETPLHQVIKKQYFEVAELLIEQGAEVNAINAERMCPLHYAAESKNKALTRQLIEKGAEVNCVSNKGVTPLQIAVESKQPTMASLLLDKGGNLLYGNPSPLRLLFDAKCGKAMHSFLLHALTRRNINEQTDYSFDWVLRNVIATRNLAVIKTALQQKNLDANYRIQNANMTVLGLATLRGNIGAVRLFIEYGADVNMPVHARKKTRGKAPLHYAALRGFVKIAKLLIEHGADINAKSSHGNTPLKYALKHQHKDMIQLLEKHGAVIE